MVSEVEDMPWEARFRLDDLVALLRFGRETLDYTRSFYEVRDVSGELILVAGVALWNFVRPPELWTALAKPFLHNVNANLRMTRRDLVVPLTQYGYLVADVANDNPRDAHFVRALGFAPSGRKSLRPNADAVTQWELRA